MPDETGQMSQQQSYTQYASMVRPSTGGHASWVPANRHIVIPMQRAPDVHTMNHDKEKAAQDHGITTGGSEQNTSART